MKKIFAWFKSFLLKYKTVESRKFGERVQAHPSFATATVIFAMAAGIISVIAAVSSGEIEDVLISDAIFIVYLMLMQMAESIMVSNTTGTAFKRFALLLGYTFASFALGAVASVIIIAIVVIIIILLAIRFLIAVLSNTLFSSVKSSVSSSGSNSSNNDKDEEEEFKITDENGFERKLKSVGFGRYQDDKGDYWKSDGYNSVSREE